MTRGRLLGGSSLMQTGPNDAKAKTGTSATLLPELTLKVTSLMVL